MRPGNLEKITASYETNKRKYEAAVERADQRARDLEDEKVASGGKRKGRSLVAWRRHREKRRQEELQEALMRKMWEKQRLSKQESETRR